MAGDPFSSHPYPGMKQIVSVNYHCEDCDKTIRSADKAAHQRGKKHALKVAEKNGTVDDASPWAAAPAASDNGCHNCHELDHISRDCPKPRADTRECHFCHEVGHAKADCPNKPRNSCFNCGEEGHRKGDCPNERQILCRNCDGPGHVSRECPEPMNPAKIKCNNCEQMGHMMRACPEPKDWSKVQCRNCGNMGHTPVRCKAEPMASDVSSWDNLNGTSASEPWTDPDATVQPSGSWDDSTVATEAAPTKSWDDTEVPAVDGGADDGWETVAAKVAPVESTNGGWEGSTATEAVW